MSSVPPDPRTWPSFGVPTPRVSERELREDAEIHERQEEMPPRTSWWRRVLRRRSGSK